MKKSEMFRLMQEMVMGYEALATDIRLDIIKMLMLEEDSAKSVEEYLARKEAEGK